MGDMRWGEDGGGDDEERGGNIRGELGHFNSQPPLFLFEMTIFLKDIVTYNTSKLHVCLCSTDVGMRGIRSTFYEI